VFCETQMPVSECQHSRRSAAKHLGCGFVSLMITLLQINCWVCQCKFW